MFDLNQMDSKAKRTNEFINISFFQTNLLLKVFVLFSDLVQLTLQLLLGFDQQRELGLLHLLRRQELLLLGLQSESFIQIIILNFNNYLMCFTLFCNKNFKVQKIIITTNFTVLVSEGFTLV